jgi:hypothetical protein
MGLFSGFRDGFIFSSDMFFEHQGAYTCVPQRPAFCDKCLSNSGSFHAHGRYKRWLKTLRNQVLTRIRIWKHRWLCLCCGRTMNTGPPDVIAHIPLCTLVIVALLWSYLDGQSGIHNCIAPEFSNDTTARSLARYLKRAKAVCLKTQQAIREVLIEIKEPRPWEECFAHGLPPPQSLIKRHRDPSQVTILWRALAMLMRGSETLSVNPCLLMARARKKAEQRKSQFLI